MARLKDFSKGTKDIFMLDPRVLQIRPGFNVRHRSPDLEAHIRWLADSIKEKGVEMPLVVTLDDDKIFVEDGHNRLEATMLAISEGADIQTVPARAGDRYANEADRVAAIFTRNGGLPLQPLEKAELFKRLLDYGNDIAWISRKVGLTSTQVSTYLELLAAPVAVTNLIKDGKVSPTLASEVLKEHGTAAGSVLEQAVETAKQQGKEKATRKHIKKDEPKKDTPQQVASFSLDMSESPGWKALAQQLKSVIEDIRDADSVQERTAALDEGLAILERWPKGDV